MWVNISINTCYFHHDWILIKTIWLIYDSVDCLKYIWNKNGNFSHNLCAWVMISAVKRIFEVSGVPHFAINFDTCLLIEKSPCNERSEDSDITPRSLLRSLLKIFSIFMCHAVQMVQLCYFWVFFINSCIIIHKKLQKPWFHWKKSHFHTIFMKNRTAHAQVSVTRIYTQVSVHLSSVAVQSSSRKGLRTSLSDK